MSKQLEESSSIERLDSLFEVEQGWGDPAKEVEEKKGLWFHVPAKGSLVVAMLSIHPVLFRGHWMDKRFHLCRNADHCQFCARGWPRDPRWAFSVYELGSRRSGLLEVGAVTASEVQNWSNRAGSLRGLVLKFYKVGETRFGRVAAVPADAVINSTELPEPCDVEGSLLSSFGKTDTLTLPSLGPRRS